MSGQYQPPKYEPLDISQFQQSQPPQQQQQPPPQQYQQQNNSVKVPKYEPLDISQFQQSQPPQQPQEPQQQRYEKPLDIPQFQNYQPQQVQQKQQLQPQQQRYEPVNFFPQKPNNFEFPSGIRGNKKENKDNQYRDSINEKVNNLKLSLPNQERAQHIFDQSLIDNNPRYMNMNIQELQSRKDNRDGINNKMDGFMFQQFNQLNMNSSYTPSSNSQSYQEPSNNFVANLPSNFNNVFQQTSRINNRDLNNERMNTIASLPRALNQPNQMLDNRVAAASFKASYQDQYKPFSSNMDPSMYNFNNQPNRMNQSIVLQDEGLLRKNESSRVNNKDTYNERMQNLMPLPRTAAIPITTSDYNKSIKQNIQLMENGRNYKHSDMDNRQEMAEQKKKEWERMSNNIKLFGNQNKIVVDFNRPQDTRQ
jgi:hypothetical protein